MMRTTLDDHRRLIRFLLILLILAGLGFVLMEPRFHQEEAIAQAQSDDLAFETELEKGRDLLGRRKYEDALKSFRRANEMRGKKSAEALIGMAQSYIGLDAYKSVVETSEKVIELAGIDALLRAQAYNYKGLGLQSQSELKDEKKMRAAEAAFREALALEVATLPVVRYNLGVVLLQQGRDAEGVAELQSFLKTQPGGGYADQARRMVANPRRAREAYAPDFSIVTAEGDHIFSEDLLGKVIVLDFWGTWCAPCVASVPSLRSLQKKFAKEPQFVLIGISSDREEETWREFIVKERMIWPQYLDSEGRVQRAFNVHAFPTYIVIDHEGIVRYRSSGTSWERSASLSDMIKKQVKIVAKTDAAN